MFLVAHTKHIICWRMQHIEAASLLLYIRPLRLHPKKRNVFVLLLFILHISYVASPASSQELQGLSFMYICSLYLTNLAPHRTMGFV